MEPMPETLFPAIPGVDDVVRWFGRWPSFHDAEVLEVDLQRSGRSAVRIWAFRMTRELDASRHFVLDRHAVVTFWLEDVADLELDDFSVQNVISSLTLEPSPRGFKLTLSPCFGIAGYIEAARVSVAIEAAEPETP